MTYRDKLQAWYEAERLAGRVLDLKFFPEDLDGQGRKLTEDELEAKCKAVFETLTGVIPSRELPDKALV